MEEKKSLTELPYEKLAMSGAEAPEDLEYPDQILFMSLSLLYERYRKGIIDRDTARKEKIYLLDRYYAQLSRERAVDFCVEQIKRTEAARKKYRENKTIENADALLKCLEGGK